MKIKTITPSGSRILSAKPMSAKIRSAKPMSAKPSYQTHGAPSEDTYGTKDYDVDEMELDIKEDMGENDEFYDQAENIRRLPARTGKPLSSKSRPISGLTVGNEEFYSTFLKYTNFQEVEQSYPELFDR